jgi:hypothetical protein
LKGEAYATRKYTRFHTSRGLPKRLCFLQPTLDFRNCAL